MAALSKKAPASGGFEIGARDRLLVQHRSEKPRRLDGVFYCPVSGSTPRRWTNDRPSNFRSSSLRLHGLWLPLVTPFRDGELDEASLRRLVRHYAALPVNGLVLAATTGEGLTLEPSRNRTAGRSRCATKPAATRLFRSCLGLSGSNTARCCDTLDANRGMADRRLSDLLPVLFAAVAARAGASLQRARRSRRASDRCSTTFPTGPASISATRRCCALAAHPNIVGLKDCCADRNQSIDLLRRRPHRLSRC